MSTDIRRFSAAQAKAHAESLAVRYARARGVEGKLVSADPDKFETERLGKTPVFWVVVFEQTHHGKTFDGPVAYRLNLATGEVVGV